MKIIKIFASNDIEYNDPHEKVEMDANGWLADYPNANILASHTNMINLSKKDPIIEFSLTLIIEFPDPDPEIE